MKEEFAESVALLIVLLNPILMSLYLADLFERLTAKRFAQVITRATCISTAVFIFFTLTGVMFFEKIIQARFASFLIFGGIIFLIIGVQYLIQGTSALNMLRGDPDYVEGSVAMPFMIGPGTISASVVTGLRLDPIWAVSAIVTGMVLTVLLLLFLKHVLDSVRRRSEPLVIRYYEVAGRLSALIIGTFAVEMIIQGIEDIFGSG